MIENRTEELPLIELIRREVDELTLNHQDTHWQDALDENGRAKGRKVIHLPRLPLIAQIRAGIYGDTGKTHGGHNLASQRGLMDLGAFELYEDITGRIDASFKYLTGQRPRETAEATLRAWFVAYQNEYRKNLYPEATVKQQLSELRAWSRRIRAHFDPPRQKELAGPCPALDAEGKECAQSEYVGLDGSKHTALFVQYRNDESPEARCRCCGARWEGTLTLLNLGYYLGANVDHDTLRQMGVVA